MIRLLPGLIFLGIATLLLVALLSMDGGKPTAQSPLVGTRLPALAVLAADSQPAPIDADTLNAPAVVLNVFASWCTPCALEMEELVALKRHYPNARFVGIVWNDAPATITPWLKKYGNPFDQVHYDPKGRAAIALGLRGIPETFILDSTGVIRFHRQGVIDSTMRREQMAPLLETLTQPESK